MSTPLKFERANESSGNIAENEQTERWQFWKLKAPLCAKWEQFCMFPLFGHTEKTSWLAQKVSQFSRRKTSVVRQWRWWIKRSSSRFCCQQSAMAFNSDRRVLERWREKTWNVKWMVNSCVHDGWATGRLHNLAHHTLFLGWNTFETIKKRSWKTNISIRSCGEYVTWQRAAVESDIVRVTRLNFLINFYFFVLLLHLFSSPPLIIIWTFNFYTHYFFSFDSPLFRAAENLFRVFTFYFRKVNFPFHR